MERLTEKQRNYYIRTNEHIGVGKESLVDNNGFLTDYANKILTKLADYEDAEEVGLLIHLPGKTVYHIVNQYTSYGPMVMATRIIDLTIVEIMGIDKDGKYWSTRERAEEEMEVMRKSWNG